MALVVRALKDQLAAQPDRLINGLLTGGVWKPSASFEVTAPGGMFVAVGSGTEGDLAVVEGSASRQGVYIVENPDGTYDAGGGADVAIAPGDASDDRIDLIVLRVYDDDADSSGQTDALVEVVEGTPASSPTVPSVPDSSIALAEVSVSAGESTAITTGDITDDRTYCQVRGSGVDASADGDLVPYSHMRDYAVTVLDYVEVTASDNDRGGAGVIFDWDNLEVTVNVDAGRRLRITGHAQLAFDVEVDQWKFPVREGTTELGRWASVRTPDFTASLWFETFEGSVIVEPSSGSHTYKLSGERIAGTGEVDLFASSTAPAFILVEDIGPA